MLSGIDVSKYQGTVSWPSVHGAGTAFAFAKATEGTTIVDPQFAQNWAAMAAAGLARGAYHFFRASQDAAQQAAWFLKTVSLGPADLPAVLDVELTDGASTSTIVSGITTWLQAVEQGTSKRPIIYTAPGFWNGSVHGSFGMYPLWVAHYTSAAQPTIPNGWNAWTFWQYSQSGTIAGVHGAVDLDRFNGDQAALTAFIGAAAGTAASTSTSISSAGSSTSGGTGSSGSTQQTYTVKAGDTLGAIAAEFGTTVSAISAANGISNPNKISVGEVLIIPS